MAIDNIQNLLESGVIPSTVARERNIDLIQFLSQVNASGMIGAPSGFKSNVWYYLGLTATTANTLGNGTLRLCPVFIPIEKTLDRIGAEITGAGESGSTLRLGIYRDDGTGFPGALLLDAGTIDATSATVQQITINQVITPGVYWIGGAVQGAPTTQPTVRNVSTFAHSGVGTAGGSAAVPNQGLVGYSQAAVTAGLPATFTTTVTIGGSAPRVFWRFA